MTANVEYCGIRIHYGKQRRKNGSDTAIAGRGLTGINSEGRSGGGQASRRELNLDIISISVVFIRSKP